MGADCCGGEPANGVEAMAALSLKNKATQPAPVKEEKPWSEIAKEHEPYFAKRVELFDKYWVREEALLEAAKQAAEPLRITLPDGNVREAIKDVTTPLDIANSLSKSLAKKAVVAEVNDGTAWDLFRPLEYDCSLAIHTFESKKGKEAFWHSSAHMLGQALELEFGAELTIGPDIEEGFYYDSFLGERSLKDGDRETLRARMQRIVKERQEFRRVRVSRAEALEMFAENKFKVEMISALPDDKEITCYRCGPMVDLCRGPHVPNTGLLKAVAVTQASRAFWRADVTKDPLQRVYGVTFPDDKELKQYQHRIEEAKKRDHRVLGASQELFFFHSLSPGSCFFLPPGARVFNTLIEFMRQLYWKYGFEEVVTPNIFNMDLWHTSGHAGHYKDNMFCFQVEKAEYGLKPMNCPGHCLLFGHRTRSYRELPLRLAEFGVLHRNEYSGALQGLTRVRRFQQDDAHVFVREDQIAAEMVHQLAMLREAYGVLGLEFEAVLSTRPDDFLGSVEQWDAAETALRESMAGAGLGERVEEGDGAFYGPKIDITVFDALRRRFQCATLQLDFQMPQRFGLAYTAEDGSARAPVIIHRAVLGSVERMFAILTEHYAGKWPLWLSPRQVMVVPISEASYGYAAEVRDAIRARGFFVEVDTADRKMQKKVREAQIAQFNYILVVGNDERAARTVNVRTRDNQVHGERALDEVLAVLEREREQRSLHCCFEKAAPADGAAQPTAADGDAADA